MAERGLEPGALGGLGARNLLEEVGQRRSVEAFSELLRRYGGLAYRVALKVTGSPDLAEEAVQEGFLKVWRKAGACRPVGSVQAWLVIVFQREALRQLRARRRWRGLPPGAGGSGGPAEAGVEPDLGACCELGTGVKRALSRLEPAQREVLALYFSAGMSQQQIGAQLSVSQRTVSHRLRSALASLRGWLRGEGLFSWATVLSESRLRSILEQGLRPLPGFERRLLERVGLWDRTGKGARLWMRPGLGLSLPARCLVLGCFLAALGGLLGLGAVPAPAPSLGGRLSGASGKDRPGGGIYSGYESGTEGGVWTREWLFAAGLDPELTVLCGELRWQPPAAGIGGRMVVAAGRETTLRLPIPAWREPFLVEIELARATGPGSWMAHPYLIAGAPGQERRIFRRGWWPPKIDLPPHLPRRYCIYFFGREDAQILLPVPEGRQLRCVREYEQGFNPSGVVVLLQNVEVEAIRVRPVGGAELDGIKGRVRGFRQAPGVRCQSFPAGLPAPWVSGPVPGA